MKMGRNGGSQWRPNLRGRIVEQRLERLCARRRGFDRQRRDCSASGVGLWSVCAAGDGGEPRQKTHCRNKPSPAQRRPAIGRCFAAPTPAHQRLHLFLFRFGRIIKPEQIIHVVIQALPGRRAEDGPSWFVLSAARNSTVPPSPKQCGSLRGQVHTGYREESEPFRTASVH